MLYLAKNPIYIFMWFYLDRIWRILDKKKSQQSLHDLKFILRSRS